MLAEAATDPTSLSALWPAVAAIVVALIGLVGNIVLRQRRGSGDEEDSNVISALATALAAEKQRADEQQRRADQCEAREQARRHRNQP